MTREELQNQFGIAICEYCRKHVISEYNLRKGWVCEKSYHKEAQDGYAAKIIQSWRIDYDTKTDMEG